MKSQAETIAELSARCDGPNQFENFDRAFRASLNVSKAALLKEEERLKRARARKKRAKKHG
jgi:transcriptional regulator GlxA family with amidase domain